MSSIDQTSPGSDVTEGSNVDWSQRPIVIVNGDAPDTQEFRSLQSRLKFLFERGEIEVIWTNGQRSPFNPLAMGTRVLPYPSWNFNDDPSRRFELLDFTFRDTSNPALERRTKDPKLHALFGNTDIPRPPIVEIDLLAYRHANVQLMRFVERSARIRKHSLDVTLYHVVPEIQDRYLAHVGISNSPTFSPHYSSEFKFSITPPHLDKPSASSQWITEILLNEELVRFKTFKPKDGRSSTYDDPELISMLKGQPIGADLSDLYRGDPRLQKLAELYFTDTARTMFDDSREGAIHFLKTGDFTTDEIISALSTLDSIVESLKKKRMSLMIATPEEIPERLRTEIELERQRLKAIQDQTAEALQELEITQRDRDSVAQDIAAERASLEDVRDEIEGLHDEITQRHKRLEILTDEKLRATTLKMRTLAEINNSFEMLEEATGWKNKRARNKRISEVLLILQSEASDFDKLSMQFLIDAVKPVNLFDATYFFFVQRVVDNMDLRVPRNNEFGANWIVWQEKIETTIKALRDVGPVGATTMLQRSHASASPEELKWFLALDDLLPYGIGNEIFIHLVNAEISRKFEDGRVPMSFIDEVLRGMVVGNGRVQLPTTSPADALPANGVHVQSSALRVPPQSQANPRSLDL